MSVRLCKLQHQKHIFTYKEQLQPDQSQRPGQKYVLGRRTDTMQANAIQRRHEKTVLIGVTFDMNHIELPCT